MIRHEWRRRCSTHTHTTYVCFAASLTVQYSAFVFSAAAVAAAAAAPALYFGKTVASHIGDASPIACKLLPVLPLVAKRRVYVK